MSAATYEASAPADSAPAPEYTAYTTEGVSNDTGAGEEVAEVISETPYTSAPEYPAVDPTKVEYGELLTPEREEQIAQQNAMDAQHEAETHAQEEAAQPTRPEHYSEEEWASMGPQAKFAALAVSDILDDTNFINFGGGSPFGTRRASAETARPAPGPQPEVSTQPEGPRPISAERYASASQALETALATAHESPLPSRPMIHFLETSQAKVVEQSEEGNQLVRDIEQVGRTITSLDKRILEEESRDMTFEDLKSYYDRQQKKAVDNGDTEKAAGLQRRRNLIWMLSNRGNVDLFAVLNAPRGR